jgi:hypothetical protein
MGAGSIGLLTAAVLRLRQMEVEIVSVEPEGSDRAMLAQIAGAEYRTSPDRPADIAIEAAGAPEAVSVAANALAPLGVLVVLGAKRSGDPLPFLNLILGNQIRICSGRAVDHSARVAQRDGAIPKFLRVSRHFTRCACGSTENRASGRIVRATLSRRSAAARPVLSADDIYLDDAGGRQENGYLKGSRGAWDTPHASGMD